MNNKLLVIVGIIVVVLVAFNVMGYELKGAALHTLALSGFALGVVFSGGKRE
jgi:hypothetical protein